MDKPTSKSARLMNNLVVATIMIVWVIVCISKKEIVPLDLSLVALIFVLLSGRAGIEAVQTIAPNISYRK
jgi:hypothetical protein